MPSHQAPDGRFHHTFSASWLKEYATCPERARRRYFGITAQRPNHYTAVGSAVHAGIEYELQGLIDGKPTDHDGMLEAAYSKLLAVMAEPGYVDDGTPVKTLVLAALDKFVEQTLPHMHPLVVEEKFDLPLHKDAFREIRLRGAIDCVDRNLGIIDWKTAGSAHKVWEKERYEVQPTAYIWAWNRLQGVHHDKMRYVVYIHNKGVQEYTVTRGLEHAKWMAFQALAAARHVESGLPVWTMNDGGWWCSEKWCPAWSECKGLFVDTKEK